MALAWLKSLFVDVEDDLQASEAGELSGATADGCRLQPGDAIPASRQWHMGPKRCPMSMTAYIRHRNEAKSKGKQWDCCSPGGGKTVDGAEAAAIREHDLYYTNSPRRDGHPSSFLRGAASAEVQNLSAVESLRGNTSIGVYTRAEDTMYGSEAQREERDNVTTMPYAGTGATLASANW